MSPPSVGLASGQLRPGADRQAAHKAAAPIPAGRRSTRHFALSPSAAGPVTNRCRSTNSPEHRRPRCCRRQYRRRAISGVLRPQSALHSVRPPGPPVRRDYLESPGPPAALSLPYSGGGGTGTPDGSKRRRKVDPAELGTTSKENRQVLAEFKRRRHRDGTKVGGSPATTACVAASLHRVSPGSGRASPPPSLSPYCSGGAVGPGPAEIDSPLQLSAYVSTASGRRRPATRAARTHKHTRPDARHETPPTLGAGDSRRASRTARPWEEALGSADTGQRRQLTGHGQCQQLPRIDNESAF